MSNSGIIIVGPHRSGTSTIGGIFHRAGYFMGDNLLPPSEYNPMGYYEDADIVDIHNRLLGDQWYSPQLITTNTRLTYEYRILLKRFVDADKWAIKDPRICYTLPLLMQFVPKNTKVIMVFRDPWYSAHSLVKRDGLSFSLALNISLSYVSEMIKNTENADLFRIRYRDVITDPISATLRLLKFAGANKGMSAETFDYIVGAINPSLAHYEKKDAKNFIEAVGGQEGWQSGLLRRS